MVSMLLCGWNAGSLGPLLPSLQSYYEVCPILLICLYIPNLLMFRLAIQSASLTHCGHK